MLQPYVLQVAVHTWLQCIALQLNLHLQVRLLQSNVLICKLLCCEVELQ